MIKQSLTLRILAISFLVLALPLLIDSFIFFQNSYLAIVEEAKKDLRQSANFRIFALAEMQPVRQVLLKEVEYLLNLEEDLESAKPEELEKKLSQITKSGGDFQLFILQIKDKNLAITASSVPNIASYFSSFFRLEDIIKQGEGTFIRFLYSPEQSSYLPYLFFARVIHSKKTGQTLGLLVAMKGIEKELAAFVTKEGGNNREYALLNTDGAVLAATDPKMVGQLFDPISPLRRKQMIDSQELGNRELPFHPLKIIQGDDPLFFEFIFDNRIQIAYRAYVSDLDLSVIAYSPKEKLFSEAVGHFLLIYLVYGIILVAGIGVAYWISLWISRPLRQLSYLMGQVRKGNLGVRFQQEPFGFEINMLGEMFNKTLYSLLENVQKAENERVKKEKYQREIDIGRQVQKSLFPAQVPKVEGAEVYGAYLPAEQVGGDFYGIIQKKTKQGEEAIFLNVADAAGKGISSSLYSLSARSLVRSYITLYDDVGEILSRTNNVFLEDVGDTGMFVTILLGAYHSKTRVLSYYSCGHLPGIVRRNSGQLVTLNHSGMALGLVEAKESFKEDTYQLESGDLVVFFTKGLIEAANEKHQHFSERRLRNLLQERKWISAKEAVDGITQEVKNFVGDIPQDEEIIIVALSVK